MGGASAVASIQCALAVIQAGICKHVLLSLGRTGYSGGRIGTRVQQMPQFRIIGEFEMPLGAIAPAQLYARWRGGTWNCTAPRPASWRRSR